MLHEELEPSRSASQRLPIKPFETKARYLYELKGQKRQCHAMGYVLGGPH